jgi:SAM-dependent methyltransferase
MVAIDLTARSRQDELMDTEPVSFEEFRACLVDLARVNRLTRAHRPTLAFLDRVARARRSTRPIEVLDVGSGYGDMLRAIGAWSRRKGVAVSLTGVDLNRWSSRAAAAATAPDLGIRWATADVFSYDSAAEIDVVVSSLFTHHLPDPLVVSFVRWMEARARLGWFVSDLHRHPVPYHFFRHYAKLARLHRFVQHDGPVSIARAFRAGDWERLVAEAGLDPAAVEVQWRAPFRLTVTRLKAA